MYFRKFSLNCPPFAETAQAAFYFPAQGHESTQAAVEERIQAGWTLSVIVGPPGVGKTVAMHRLAERLAGKRQVIRTAPPPGGEANLLATLAANWAWDETNPTDLVDKVGLVNALTGSRKPALVLLDQAENLSAENLGDLDTLRAAAEAHKCPLVIVLFGQPELAAKIRSTGRTALVVAAQEALHIEPLNEDETGGYIEHRLGAAGGSGVEIITSEAQQRIAALAHGIPRAISEICTRLLEIAARRGVRVLDDPHVAQWTSEDQGQTGLWGSDDALPRPHDSGDDVTWPGSGPRGPDRPAAPPVEPLVARLAELLADGPQKLAALKHDVDDLVAKAGAVAAQASGQGPSRAVGRTDNTSGRSARTLDHALIDLDRMANATLSSAEERLALLLTSLEAAKTIQDRIQQMGQETLHLADDARRSACAEQDKLSETIGELAGQRTQLVRVIEELREQQAGAVAGIRHAVDESLTRADRVAAEMRTYTDSIQNQTANVMAKLAGLADLEQRCTQALNQTAEACGRLAAVNAAAQANSDKLQAQIAQAGKSAEQAVNSAGEGVRAIGQAGTLAHNQIAEAAERLEKYALIEQDARQSAEQALQAAKRSVITAQQCERKLAEAQSHAIDVEGATAAALAALHKETARMHEAVQVAVSSGRDRIASEAEAAAAEAFQQFRSNFDQMLQSGGKQLAELNEALVEMRKRFLSTQEALGTVVNTGLEKVRAERDEAVSAALATGTQIEGRLAEGMRRFEEMQASFQKFEAAAQQQIRDAEQATRVAVSAATGKVRALAGTAVDEVHRKLQSLGEEFTGRNAAIAQQTEQRLAERTADLEQALEKAAQEQVRRMTERMRAVADEGIQQWATQRSAAETHLREQCEHVQTVVDSGIQQWATQRSATETHLREQSEQFLSEAQRTAEKCMAEAQGECVQQIRKATESVELRLTERAQRLTDTCTRADHLVGQLAEALTSGKHTVLSLGKEKAEGQTCIEQINGVIGEVWSLTSTTDERVRSLTLLAESAERLAGELGRHLTQVREQSPHLAALIAAAERSGELLSGQQRQVHGLTEDFARQIGEARTATTQLSEAQAAAGDLRTRIAAQSTRFGEFVEAAQSILPEIRQGQADATALSESVQRISAEFVALQTRVDTVTMTLNNPLKIIQEADQQAQEMTRVCAAVKRVFRDVSRASLEAHERGKRLTRMQGNAEKTTAELKQLVRQATTAQSVLGGMFGRLRSVWEPTLSPEPNPASRGERAGGAVAPAEARAAVVDAALRSFGERGSAAPTPTAVTLETPGDADRTGRRKPRLTATQIEALIAAAKSRAEAEPGPSSSQNNPNGVVG